MSDATAAFTDGVGQTWVCVGFVRDLAPQEALHRIGATPGVAAYAADGGTVLTEYGWPPPARRRCPDPVTPAMRIRNTDLRDAEGSAAGQELGSSHPDPPGGAGVGSPFRFARFLIAFFGSASAVVPHPPAPKTVHSHPPVH